MGSSLEDIIREKAKKCNNTHFLIVDGMSKFLDEKVGKCESSIFQAFGIEWYFQIRSYEKKGYVSVYLYITSDSGVECDFKFNIVPQTGESDCFRPISHFFEEKESGYGRGKFVSHEVLRKKYIVNDKAVFYVEITNVSTKSPSTLNKGTAECVRLTEVPRTNSKFTWKITRFSSFTGESHSSYEFTVGQRRWKLEMYPEGNARGEGHLSVYLVAADYEAKSSMPPTTAAFKLRVLDQVKLINHKEHYISRRTFSSRNVRWGLANFMPLEELRDTSRGFLLKDEIYIGVEFFIVSSHEIL